jgi:MFS family permease
MLPPPNNIVSRWRWPSSLSAMRYRNFRLFFFGQLVSVTGTWMQATAQQWLVYRLTGSQLSLGAVDFANYLPVLLLSLFMGIVVDRVPRRRLLVITQSWFTLLAAVLALITYLGIVQYWHILLLSALMGLGTALDMPARQALYVDMVEREDLINAIALNSSVFNGARIIGPALSGILVAALGEAPAFAVNALSYLAVIAGLLLMRLLPRKQPLRNRSGGSAFMEGVRYIAGERRTLGLVSMTALYNLLAFPFVVLLPVFARDILHTGVEGFGGLVSARGAGALVGAAGIAIFGMRQHKGRMLILSRGLTAVAAAGLAFSKTQLQASLSLSVAGFGMIMFLANTNTLIQLLVPEELRGRVMSSFTWALGGFWPLGSLLMGYLGDRIGSQATVLFAAATSIILAIAGLFLFPETKKMA